MSLLPNLIKINIYYPFHKDPRKKSPYLCLWSRATAKQRRVTRLANTIPGSDPPLTAWHISDDMTGSAAISAEWGTVWVTGAKRMGRWPPRGVKREQRQLVQRESLSVACFYSAWGSHSSQAQTFKSIPGCLSMSCKWITEDWGEYVSHQTPGGAPAKLRWMMNVSTCTRGNKRLGFISQPPSVTAAEEAARREVNNSRDQPCASCWTEQTLLLTPDFNLLPLFDMKDRVANVGRKWLRCGKSARVHIGEKWRCVAGIRENLGYREGPY